MRIFKTIFGNYDEQRKLWTDLANSLWDIFAAPIDKLESFLSKALGFDAIREVWDKITNNPIVDAVKEVDGAIKKSSKTLEEYQAIVRKVWRGDFNNRGDNPDRFDLLSQAGWDPRVVQSLVNKTDDMAGYGKGWTVIDKLTIDDVTEAERKYGIQVENSTEAVAEQKKVTEKLTDEMLTQMGLSQEQIDLYRDLEAASKKYGYSIDEIIEKMSNTDGRTHLEGIWREMGTIIKETLGAVGKAMGEVFHFNPINLYLGLEKLHEKLTSIRELLIGVYDDEGNLVESKHYRNLIDTLKGLFSILKLIKTIVGGGLKIGVTIISTILKAFGLTILDVTGAIGNIITHIVDWIEENEFIIKGIQWLVTVIMSGIDWLWSWADAHWGINQAVTTLFGVFKKGKNTVKNFIEGFVEAGDKGKYLMETFGKIPAKIKSVWNAFKETKIGQVVMGWWKAIKESDFGKAISGWFDGIKNLDFVQKMKDYFNSFDGGSIGKNIMLGLWNGIKTYGKIAIDGIKNFGIWLLEGIKKVLGIHSPSVEFFEIGKNIVLGLFNGIKTLIGMVYDLVTSIGGKLIETIRDLDIGSIFVGLVSAGAIMGLIKLAQAMNILADGLQNINDCIGAFAEVQRAFAGVLKAAKIKIMTSALKDIAISVAILAASIFVLSKIEPGPMWIAIGGIAVLVVLLGALVALSGVMGKGESLQLGKMALLVLALGVAMGMMAKALKKVAGISDAAWGSIIAFGVMIAAFMGIIKILAGNSWFDAGAIAGVLLAVGVTFKLMGSTVKKLGKLDTKQMIQGMIGIGLFTGMIVGLIAATKLIGGKSKSIEAIGKTLALIGVTFYLMAVTVKKLGKLSLAEITQGTIVLGAFVGMIVGLIAATQLLGRNSKQIQSIGKTLMQVGVAILLMGVTTKLLGNMDTGKLIKGMIAVGLFEGMIISLIAAIKQIGGTDCKNLGTTLMGVAVAIGIMSLSCALLSLMKIESLAKGIIAVGLLSKFMEGLIKSTSGSHIVSSKTMWAMVAAIGVMALAVGLLSIIKPEKLIAPTIAMGALMFIFKLMIESAKQLDGGKQMTANLGIMIGLVVVMGAVVAALSFLNAGKALAGAAAVAIIAAGLIAVMYVLGKLDKYNPDVLVDNLLGMVLVLGTLAIAIAVLKQLNGINNVGTGIAALGVMVAGLAGVMYVLGNMKTNLGDAVKGAAGLAILMASLLVGVHVLKQMDGVSDVTGAALGLVILVGGLTLVMFALSKIGGLTAKALLGVVGIAALMATLLIAVQVLKQMSGIENAAQNALVLAAFMGALTIILLLTAAVGAIYTATAGIAATGLLGLLACIAMLFMVVAVLKQMADVKNAEANVTLLTGLMTVMTDMLFKISLVGPLALMAVTALGALMLMMPIMIAFAVALGALFSYIPELQGFLDTGLPIMIQVAGAMGEMIGAFVSGALTQLSAALPEIGMNLSLFMVNATPFIVGMKMVNGQTLKGAGIMAGVILALTAVDVINGIASFFTGGFARLGTELSEFAINALPFLATMAAVPPSALNGVKSLAQAVLCLTAANILDGLSRFFGGGGSSLASFGQQLPPLGTSLAGFVSNLGVFTEEQVATVDCAGRAIAALAEASKSLPKSGGWAQKIFGEGSLKDFAEDMPEVAKGVVNFVKELGTFEQPQIDTANCACEVIKAIAKAAKSLPSEGGFWQKLFGSKNDGLAQFAANMPKVGEGVAGFIGKLDAVKDKASVADAGAKIIEGIAKLADLDFKKANENLPKFGDTMNTYGDKLKTFIEKMKGFSKEDVETANGNLTLVTTAAQNMMNTVKNEIDDNSNSITSSMEEVVKHAVQGINSDKVKSEVSSQASNFVQGFINGIKSNTNMNGVYNAAYTIGQQAVKGLAAGQDAHSPSRETMQQGNFFGEGFIMGIDQYSSKIYRVTEAVGQEATRGLSAAVAKMSSLVDSDVGNPTIRPVLDLSDVENGAGLINSMFGNPSLQLASNLNSISSGMKSRVQNGNSDVVSAIDKLGKNLETNGGNTYNLGGISYSDDTAIGRAVQELVRAVEVEGRM